nr:TraR/DksA C4-type zinc finger protein [Amphritea atlantica]
MQRTEPEQQTLDGRIICIDCDSPIAHARLAAKPNAARCVHCQLIEEQKHGR